MGRRADVPRPGVRGHDRPTETIEKAGGTSYIFVTKGIDAALRRAREAAGPADVMIVGGADVAGQYLRAGAIDELWLHVAPMILGAGTPLFGAGPWPAMRLRPLEVESVPLATHLIHEVERPAAGER